MKAIHKCKKPHHNRPILNFLKNAKLSRGKVLLSRGKVLLSRGKVFIVIKYAKGRNISGFAQYKKLLNTGNKQVL
jgi:hypothetical protein